MLWPTAANRVYNPVDKSPCCPQNTHDRISGTTTLMRGIDAVALLEPATAAAAAATESVKRLLPLLALLLFPREDVLMAIAAGGSGNARDTYVGVSAHDCTASAPASVSTAVRVGHSSTMLLLPSSMRGGSRSGGRGARAESNHGIPPPIAGAADVATAAAPVRCPPREPLYPLLSTSLWFETDSDPSVDSSRSTPLPLPRENAPAAVLPPPLPPPPRLRRYWLPVAAAASELSRVVCCC